MMRRFLSILLIVLCTFGLMMNDVQAKRFGGGRSFGMSRSIGGISRPQGLNGFNTYGQSASTGSRWLGPLAGMALGGLLATLFMGHGLNSGIILWLVLAGIAMFYIKFMRQRTQTYPSQGYNNTYESAAVRDTSAYFRGNASSAAGVISDYPEGFDREAFLREAKVQFIRLQAAYDQKNLADIRQFTTPEVFAEIQMQFHERGAAANQTEVVLLNASLMDVAAETQGTVASVQFTGMIREQSDAPAAPLNEIWHFKSQTPGSWIVAGVQQPN